MLKGTAFHFYQMSEDGSKSSSSLVTAQAVVVMLHYLHPGVACGLIQDSTDVA